MMNGVQYLELMSKYLSGNINPTERKQLLAWAEASPANQAFFDEMIQLWSISDAYEEPAFEVDEQQAWARLEPRLDDPEVDHASNTPERNGQNGGGYQLKIIPIQAKRRTGRLAAAVAAIVILSTIALYQVFSLRLDRVVITQAGEREEVLLPDGTKVLLNQTSILSYSARFTQRKVSLEGEAFFEVARIPERPFSVSSGKVTTTVLGTAFNIRAYPQEATVEVAVQEGRVQVEVIEESENQTAAQLRPGEAIRYDKQAQVLEPTEVEMENVMVWKSSSLSFEDEAFTTIASKLERYFNVEIELAEKKYSNCPFTIDKMMRPKLEDIFLILEGLDFEVEEIGPGQYRISGGMCE